MPILVDSVSTNLCALGDSSAGLHRTQDSLRGERSLAQTRPDGVEDRVSDRAEHRNNSRLAGAGGWILRPIFQDDVYLRHVAKSNDRIASPVHTFDSRFGELPLLHHRAPHTLYGVGLDLELESVGIDDQAAIVSDSYALHRHVSGGPVHFNLGHSRDQRVAPRNQRDASSRSLWLTRSRCRRRTLLPSRLLNGRLQQLRSSLVAGQLPYPKLK